ncbi:AAA family ATPase [Geobacter sp. FeAm09]|uniref:AAA family ATPase n=1 Tax=Geobacter sp. FeAm09 TaxID=2597769 RepID=UPI00143E02B0|nr:AAA family ATPase [Geobacter sp. FeAm09]
MSSPPIPINPETNRKFKATYLDTLKVDELRKLVRGNGWKGTGAIQAKKSDLVHFLMTGERPEYRVSTQPPPSRTKAATAPRPASPTQGMTTHQARPRLLVPLAEIMKEPLQARPLIGNLIRQDTTGVLFGPSGSGKTFIGVDLACSVATGSTWAGHQCQQGAVLYLWGEAHSGQHQRFSAWQHDRELDPCNQITVTSHPMPLNPATTEDLIEAAHAFQAQCGRPIRLIVVDTLARHIEGDENAAHIVQGWTNQVDALRRAFPGSSAIIIHHTGNDTSRMRGSSALFAAMDFVMRCHDGYLSFGKMKDGRRPAQLKFELSEVELGADDNGEIVTSCVPEYDTTKNPESTGTDLDAKAVLAGQTLGHLGVKATDREWQAAFVKAYTQRKGKKTDSDTIRKYFRTARASLIESGHVTDEKGSRMLTSKGIAAFLKTDDQRKNPD